MTPIIQYQKLEPTFKSKMHDCYKTKDPVVIITSAPTTNRIKEMLKGYNIYMEINKGLFTI